ncbi:uncharacterized protein METZ01_LOCUS112096, partial [marine metagenome]
MLLQLHWNNNNQEDPLQFFRLK